MVFCPINIIDLLGPNFPDATNKTEGYSKLPVLCECITVFRDPQFVLPIRGQQRNVKIRERIKDIMLKPHHLSFFPLEQHQVQKVLIVENFSR